MNLQGLYDERRSAEVAVKLLMEAFARCSKADEIGIMTSMMEASQALAALDMEIIEAEDRAAIHIEFVADQARAAA